ncbi:hypothetical protein PR048_004783 [Dryococelus australis]|uniref:Uncharacterized protein n=1 Tax=Dryococelus australis TaxID=614101 RepID=A0ABQ9I6D2_9NEOP|nr:hypothetical protein PR048_004783 [Dryococelus australis]
MSHEQQSITNEENHSEEDLVAAVRAIKRRTLSTYTYVAAERYKISRRTIRNHLKSGRLKRSLVRKYILIAEQEADLERRIIIYADIGLPVTPQIRIYHMDEKGCHFTIHHQQTVVAQKGAKLVHLQSSEHAESVTIPGCVNALCTVIPPMVIFKGKRLKRELNDNVPAWGLFPLNPEAIPEIAFAPSVLTEAPVRLESEATNKEPTLTSNPPRPSTSGGFPETSDPSNIIPDRVADMRECSVCSKWYHEDCIGLTAEYLDAFECAKFSRAYFMLRRDSISLGGHPRRGAARECDPGAATSFSRGSRGARIKDRDETWKEPLRGRATHQMSATGMEKSCLLPK